MLGFAVIDISSGEGAVAVWLTSAAGASAAHSNAVVFRFDDLGADHTSLRALIGDRYIVLTDRTDADHPILTGTRITACTVDHLAAATATSYTQLQAIARHALAAGRRGVTAPAALTVFVPHDQTALRTGTAPMVALAVADHLRVTWTAWLALNADWQRRPYLAQHPHRPGRTTQLVPPAFADANNVYPLPVPR